MTRRRLCLGLGAAVGLLLVGQRLLPEWSLGELARQASPVFHQRPWLYWLPGCAALALLLAQVTWPLLNPEATKRAPRLTSRTAFVLLTVAAVLLLRWPALACMEFNPDEGCEIAGAITLLTDPHYWRSTEGFTHGPVVEFALLPLRLLNMQLEYGSARLAGLAFLLGSLFFMFGTLRAFFPETISRATVTPVILCIALHTHFDFVAYNAEQPAIFLLSAGAYGCARLAVAPRAGGALATGLALGLVPWAKLQAVPAGLTLAVIAFACLLIGLRGQRRQQVVAVLALGLGGLAPTVLVVAYLASQNLTQHFWISYISSNLAYTAGSGTGPVARVRYCLTWAWKTPLAELFIPYFLIVLVAGLPLAAVARGAATARRLLLAGTAVLLASLYGIIAPGNEFSHYLLLLLLPLAFLTAVVVAALDQLRPARSRWPVLAGAALLFAVAFAAWRALGNGNGWVTPGPSIDTPGLQVAAAIRRYATPGEKLVVWGWMPRYYVLTGMPQGVCHNNTPFEMEDRGNNPHHDYFYRRFLEEFDRAQPPVFVDAVGLLCYDYGDREEFGHENYPELRERIAAGYELADELYGSRIYVARRRLAQLGLPALAGREVSVPVVPVSLRQARWSEGTAEGSGRDSYLAFALKRPEAIEAIRVKFTYLTAPPAHFDLLWRDSTRQAFVDCDLCLNKLTQFPEQQISDPASANCQRCARLMLGHNWRGKHRNAPIDVQPEGPPRPGDIPLRGSVTIPVSDTLDEFRIRPDARSWALRLEEIVLIVLPEERAGLLRENGNAPTPQSR